MSDHRLRPLRQDQGDLVTRLYAKGGEGVGKAACLLLQVPERIRGGGARFVLPVEGEPRPVSCPSGAAGLTDVEAVGNLPAMVRVDLRVAIGGHGFDEYLGLGPGIAGGMKPCRAFLDRTRSSPQSLGR